MSLDSDVALIGTGLASLVAAQHLHQRGFSVLLLNPDSDFFLEDSELSFDPLWTRNPGEKLGIERVLRSTPAQVLSELRPSFPGSVELWSETAAQSGFRDPAAPHVRERGRLWVASPGEDPARWEALEDLYVEFLDHDLKPQLLDGLSALSRFPGFAGRALDYRGLWVPRLPDVDVVRYRNGVLEFVRERLGDQKVLCGATQFEVIPEGIRFTGSSGPRTARIRLGVLAFWTPRLIQWVLTTARQAGIKPMLPAGVRMMEQWALVSRDALDPKAIAAFEDMVVLARTSGAPPVSHEESESDTGLFRLAILRRGPLLSLDSWTGHDLGPSWASGESFDSLRKLCLDLLGWDRLSVRAMRPRAFLEWGNAKPWKLSQAGVPVHVVPESDGPLFDVVRAGRRASELIVEPVVEAVT